MLIFQRRRLFFKALMCACFCSLRSRDTYDTQYPIERQFSLMLQIFVQELVKVCSPVLVENVIFPAKWGNAVFIKSNYRFIR